MGKERAERVAGQHDHFAQILNEPDERSSERVKKSSKHLRLCFQTQRLRFRFWTKLCRNCANETRIERELAKNGANLAQSKRGLIELEINQIVVAIDFVTQTGNTGELMIELQDLVQVEGLRRKLPIRACGFKFYGRRMLMQKESSNCMGGRVE